MGRGCVRNLRPHRCLPRGDHGSRSWGGAVCGTCVRTAVCPVETTAVAHGGNPQDRAASPRPRCLPKTALPPQDRNGAFSVMARDCSPSRVAPLPPQDRNGAFDP
ncbi:hypothetical protein BJP36_42785 [Moorena producens JHB]|uniref:Uncharacterized protein n=1 Tax=Moorena producens (strain JHB) TaxID=1454205 RepID=A0A9Q9SSZ7_MOOP1|nr:hypothetical protein [Moorena producens]WAN69086.1 hypothetical protein BJP36_42785 [Moorena producens JHB]